MNTDMNYNYLVNRALHSKVKRTKEGEIALAVLTAKTSIKIPTAILKNLIFFSYRTPLYQNFRKAITERGASTVLGPK